MARTHIINLKKTPDKWQTLMLHLQNALPGAFQITFPDSESARKAASRMTANIDRHPDWFPMVILQRGCTVYVFKTQHIHEVVIADDST